MSDLLVVSINKKGYEYEVHSLVKAFYPEADVKVIEDGGLLSSDDMLPDIEIRFEDTAVYFCVFDGKSDALKLDISGIDDNSVIKKLLGQLIYKALNQLTGKELPWGTLTGIRPTKIVMSLAEGGASGDEIDEYMKNVYLISDEKLKLAKTIAQNEKGVIDTLDTNGGYSLYLGIPFCPSRCLYCSFTSYPIEANKNRVDEYLSCLYKEIDFVKDHFGGRTPDSVYIGGGTPTTLSPDELSRLLTYLCEKIDVKGAKEFSVEAGRPDSITEEKLRTLKNFGVNRISVNPQSMLQSTLDLIGRKHTVTEFTNAFYLARDTGFDNINTDIILGLPGEGRAEVEKTMEGIMQLSPDSLTVHSLAVKRASNLREWIDRNSHAMINNTEDMMSAASDGASKMGMIPYYLYRQKNISGNFENVGYAKPGKEGIYNIAIMEEVQSVVALGAGTVTKRVYPDGRIERCDNAKDLANYLQRIDEMIERKEKLFAD